MKQVTAWLFDILPKPNHILTFWVTQEHQTLRCFLQQINCSLYAVPKPNSSFQSLYSSLLSHPDIIQVKKAKKKISIHDYHYSEVLELLVPMNINKQSFMTEIRDVYPVEFYNIDLSNFQYLYQHTGLFPFCKTRLTLDTRSNIVNFEILDKLTAFNYELPPVRAVQIDIEFTSIIKKNKIQSATFTTLSSKLTDQPDKQAVLSNPDEKELILDILDWITEHDPDVLVTQGGDQDLRIFASRAVAHGFGELSFSREQGIDQLYKAARYKPQGTSFMSYGGHYYKDHGYYLYGGRHHIDLHNSFTWKDGGFAGVVELARLSCIDAQRCARTSIGTNLTGMQIRQALTWGILIPSRKADVERFRSGETLVRGDRGGFIYSPRVGLHFNVASVDFSSMFPNIMVKHNISPETVNCRCCADGSGKPIPGTTWHTCQKRKGLVPLVLKTVLDKRLFYKQFKKTNKSYDQLQKTLKWILVTCFDPNTLLPFYQNNELKFEKIGDFVNRFIHKDNIQKISAIGLNTDLKIIFNPIKSVIKLPSPQSMFHIQLEKNREFTVTGDHICFILINGSLEEVEAKDVQVGDVFPVLSSPLSITKNIDELTSSTVDFVKVRNISVIPATSEYVYCLEVSNELPGFFAGTGGIFTHNCFGYQGYRNARFGRIEAHEAINAYARQSLLVAGEILQKYNFGLVAGIVDSLWGKYSDERPIESSLIDQICQEIEEATDLPISNDGTYRWIVFLPRRHEPEVGVLNRYYGVFEDGSFKVRGIELRRRDTCPFIRSAQDEALKVLSTATTKEEFYKLLTTDFWSVHDKYEASLLGRQVPVEQLFITKVIAKEPSQYVQAVHQAIAAKQLTKAGRSLQSGMKISYLVTNSTAKFTLKRVIAKDLYNGEFYDLAWYLKMLREAFTNIIPPVFSDKKYSSLRLSDFITENKFTGDLKRRRL